MQHLSNMQYGTAMNTLFGTGILGNAMTGMIRIPALLASIEAASRLGELSIRGISKALNTIGFQPKDDSWIVKTTNDWVKIDLRAHKAKDTVKLIQEIFALSILAIAATEFVSFLGGQPPQVYNHVLAFLGPVRVFEGSYLQGVRASLTAFGLV